jgi:hypothetical protein
MKQRKALSGAPAVEGAEGAAMSLLKERETFVSSEFRFRFEMSFVVQCERNFGYQAIIIIRIGYQNIPVNLDEAQRQIGIHTEYSIMSARSA